MKWKKIDLAKRLGVSRAAISKACSSGTLATNPKGLVDDTNATNIPYITAKVPDFYIPVDAHPNAKMGKVNGFKKGSGQNTKKTKPARKTECVSEPVELDIDSLTDEETETALKKEKIRKLILDQQAVELKNQKLRGDLIETSVVVSIIAMFIPEFKKRIFNEVEQHVRNICSDCGVNDTGDYLKTLNDIMEMASEDTNRSVRKAFEDSKEIEDE